VIFKLDSCAVLIDLVHCSRDSFIERKGSAGDKTLNNLFEPQTLPRPPQANAALCQFLVKSTMNSAPGGGTFLPETLSHSSRTTIP